MFTSVRIQNFRQFRDLTLEGLGQINLITGANDTGKTSLLEALFAHVSPTTPETILTIANLRGVEQVQLAGGYAWGFIFRDGDTQSTIRLESTRDDGVRESLEISVSEDSDIAFERTNGGSDASAPRVLSTSARSASTLQYVYSVESDGKSRQGVSRIQVTERGHLTERAQGFDGRPFYFQAHQPGDPQSDARRVSYLTVTGRKGQLIQALQIIDSRLSNLEVLDLGPPSFVAAEVGPGQLVPASYMGQGFERLLSVFPALLRSPGGTVMIDEIDDGLHYSVLVDVWTAIIKTAIKHNVQIFATTHSYECIEAAVKASEDHEGSLAFFRLERRPHDIEAVAAPDSRLRSAVTVGFEIR
jgi:hypothetical protein